jgi:hypothetical protein
MQLEQEQEILMYIADMAIDTFQAESLVLRAIKMETTGHKNAALAADVARTFIADAADRISHYGKNAINAFAEGDTQRMMLLGIKRFTKTTSYNTKEARRRIAQQLINEGKYNF